MSSTFPIQTNFSGGEISPRLHSRVDTGLYQGGLESCNNFLVTPQGSLLKRPGTEHRLEALQDSNNVRLFTFSRALDEDIIVEVNANSGRLVSQDGVVVTGVSDNLIANPNFTALFTNWDTEYLTNRNPFEIILDPETGQPLPNAAVDGTMRPLANGGVRMPLFYGTENTVEYDQGDTLQQVIAVIANNETTFSLSALISNTIYQGDTSLTGKVKITLGTTNSNADIFDQTIDFADFNIPETIEHVWTPTGTTVYLTITTDELMGAGISNQQGRFVSITNLKMSSEASGAGEFTFTSPWPIDRLSEVQTTMDSAKGWLFFFHRDTPIYWLTLSVIDGVNVWTFEPFSVTQPDGAGNVWTSGNGYPGVGCIHQGRLWVGSNYAGLSTIWASEVWDYSNFEIPAPPTPPETVSPADPLEFTLSNAGRIAWMQNNKRLLIGSDQGEIIGQAEGGVITSEDFDFTQDASWGAAPIQPVNVGIETLYTSVDLAQLRGLVDGGDETRSFISREVSYIAEHITRQKIRAIEYAKVPLYQLSMLLTDGTLGMCTLDRTLELQSFWNMSIGEEVLDITEADGIRGSSLWMVVRREGVLYLEELTLADEDGRPFCLDQNVVGTLDAATRVVSGLDIFDGRTVSVVLFNFGGYQLHPDVEVSGGQAQLEDWATGVPIVGLSYVASAQTLPPETGGAGQGSAQFSKRRWSTIRARINNSAIPKMNGQRPAPRQSEDLMTLSPPYYTGDIEVEDLDFDRGQIIIEQDLPLRTELSGLFGKAHTESR